MQASSGDKYDPHRHHSLMEIFDELPFHARVIRVIRGLGQPRDSGENRYARLQLLRMLAPLCAILVPAALVLCLLYVGGMTPPSRSSVEVRIMEVTEPPPLDEIEEELIEDDFEPPEPIELEFTPEIALETESPVPSPDPAFSPEPVEIAAVANIQSPVIMRGIIGNRNPGARSSALAEYGGNKETEGAVIRSLRWLKREQDADGSWPNYRIAMTGLGLLTFLAHGETPTSEEFGETVEKAIRYLVENQKPDGRFENSDGHEYSLPIAAYALCEAYALTRIPMLKDVTYKAIDVIIRGQHESGGWDYNCRQSERDDTSYMGWCAQALKAAHMAGVEHPGLADAIQLAVRGFQKNANPAGGFGYTSPGAGGLTGVGVLCLQLLGAARESEARLGLAWLERVKVDWDQPYGARPLYYWYYITQAKFHAGPEIWREWNNMFSVEMVENQVVLEGEGPDGKDIGYWKSLTESENYGPVYNTTLCALQLQVYYRYLPTFKSPQPMESVPEQRAGEDDLQIEISI